MLLALILFGLIADVGGINHVYTGGRYWREEPFNDTFENLSPVSLARFLGFWKVLTQAAFAFGGIESIAVIAGEAHNPRRTMRMAVRTVFYRIGGSPKRLSDLRSNSGSRALSPHRAHDWPQHQPALLRSVERRGNGRLDRRIVAVRRYLPAGRCEGAPERHQRGCEYSTMWWDTADQAQVMTSALSACNENVYAVSRILLAMARQSESLPRVLDSR
jgi:amino acid transporter